MTKGVILFAHNSPAFNYYKMAEYSAKRISHFLNLPITIITDENSLPDNPKFNFDNIILVEPDTSNKREFGIWINKGRYQAYDLSPYEETIVLDTDFLVNSKKLLELFALDTDFMCHENVSYFTDNTIGQELLNEYNFQTLWATVIYFRKSNKAKQVFAALEMVQKNYQHYQHIHRFMEGIYRNDYALTLALRIINGHTLDSKDIIPWNLWHVPKHAQLIAISKDIINTKYMVNFNISKNGKTKKQYIEVNDFDFHVLNKNDFVKLYE